jgi:branched-chain amino acid transport system permease protein
MDILNLAQAIWLGAVSGMNYALFASGLTLVFGMLLVVNMAHGEVFMLGAVVTYIIMTSLGVNFFLAGFIAVVAVAAFGFVFNRIAIKPVLGKSDWAPLISTVGISIIIVRGVLSLFGPTAHYMKTPVTGITSIGGVTVSTDGIMLFGVGLAAIVGLYIFLQRARIGKDMRATIQDPVGASLCGINTTKVYDYTLIIACGLAALSGVLSGALIIENPLMGQGMLLKGFAIVIVAGMGNLLGSTVLGIVIGIIESVFSTFVSSYFREALIYGIMVAVLVLRPEGLFARREQ